MQTLKDRSYFRTGGSAEFLFEPNSAEELVDQVEEIYAKKIPYFILGAGSNSLVSDMHWSGAVIKLDRLDTISIEANGVVRVGAGVSNSYLVQWTRENGLFGLEWMYRLPGQIGGTARMNARCYGGEISQFAKTVSLVSPSGELKDYDGGDCFFGYKNTKMMHDGGVVYSVDFQLSHKDLLKEDKMRFVEEDRTSKGQFVYPTCGCVFKNNYASDVSVSSGFLLELAGAKSLIEERLRVSEHHANFVLNTDNAASQEILELTFKMQEKVWEDFGVWMEYEMEYLGKMDPISRHRFTEVRSENRSFTQIKRLAEAREAFQAKLRKT